MKVNICDSAAFTVLSAGICHGSRRYQRTPTTMRKIFEMTLPHIVPVTAGYEVSTKKTRPGQAGGGRGHSPSLSPSLALAHPGVRW